MEKNSKKKIRLSKKAYSIVRVVALSVAALVLIYASYSLTDSYLNYKEDESKYADINKMFVQQETKKQSVQKTDKIDYTKSLTTWKWDYKAMLQYNDEAKGYIKLDGTRIQYPIVEHEVQIKCLMEQGLYFWITELPVLMAKCASFTVIICLMDQCLRK